MILDSFGDVTCRILAPQFQLVYLTSYDLSLLGRSACNAPCGTASLSHLPGALDLFGSPTTGPDGL